MKNSGLRNGPWDQEEDRLLSKCIYKYGEGNWYLVPQRTGLSRSPTSCRLRWFNYLNPNIKCGGFKEDEIDLIFRLYKLLGSRWSLIAGRLPGRTANDIKNLWNSQLSKTLDTQHLNNTRCNPEKVKVIKPKARAFQPRAVPVWCKVILENLQAESHHEVVSENQLPDQQVEEQEQQEKGG